MNTPTSAIPVRYIGIKPSKTDNVAHTGLTWVPRQVHHVTALEAQKLLRHPDVWELVAPEDVQQSTTQMDAALVAERVQEQYGEGQNANKTGLEAHYTPFDLPDLNRMGKRELLDYAENRYHQKLDGRSSKSALIGQIVTLANSLAAGDA